MSEHKIRVLLVEDRPQDVRLTKRAIRQAGFDLDVYVADHGAMALDMLGNTNNNPTVPLPDLVLLDWMMPLVNGEEVLAAIRSSSKLRRLPVIVLTTSTNESDIQTAYNLGCNAYLTKPVNPEEFHKTIEALGMFWWDRAILPKI